MNSTLPTIEHIARRNLDAVVTAMNYSREAVFNAHVARTAGDDTASAEAHFEAMDRLPAQVEHFEKTQFMSRADAVTVVGQLSGVHPGTIARQMHRAEKQAKADQRAARGRMIVGLAPMATATPR